MIRYQNNRSNAVASRKLLEAKFPNVEFRVCKNDEGKSYIAAKLNEETACQRNVLAEKGVFVEGVEAQRALDKVVKEIKISRDVKTLPKTVSRVTIEGSNPSIAEAKAAEVEAAFSCPAPMAETLAKIDARPETVQMLKALKPAESVTLAELHATDEGKANNLTWEHVKGRKSKAAAIAEVVPAPQAKAPEEGAAKDGRKITPKVSAILALTSREAGASRKELIEATGWKNGNWKQLFQNTGKGYCDRWGYDLTIEKKESGETFYIARKRVVAL